MKSIQFSEYGNSESIQLLDVKPAVVGAGQVRVRLEAAPLNPSDIMLTDGIYALRPDLPSATGSEGVGHVTEVGADVTAVKVGDRVLSLPFDEPGTWQEERVVDERHVARVSHDTDALQLATTGVNGATALQLLTYGGDLAPGSWVAQNAANSGVGSFVIALAKHAGLRTLNIVRRVDAVEPLLAAGADVVIVSSDTLADDIANALGEEKISLLLDAIGGEIVESFVPSLAQSANVVSYAVYSGKAPSINPFALVFKDLHVHGFWVNNWLRTSSREDVEKSYSHLVALIADGTLSTPVEAVYRLEDYAAAIEHARRTGRGGKVFFASDEYIANS